MKVLFILVFLFASTGVQGQNADTALPGYVAISEGLLHRQSLLTDHWLFHDGDKTEWASKDYNDNAWKKVATNMLSQPGDEDKVLPFSGIAWFRYKFFIDAPTLSKGAIGIKLYQSGASEIYLDGKKIQSFGTIGSAGNILAYNPQFVPVALSGLTPGNHVLAVRYGNYSAQQQRRYTIDPGFRLGIGYIDEMGQTVYANTLTVSIIVMLLLSVFATLFLVHLALYLYDTKVKANLYFSGFNFSIAVWFLGAWGEFLATNVTHILYTVDITFIALAAASFFMSGFSNTLFSKKRIRFYIISAYCLFCLLMWLLFKQVAFPAYVLMIAIVLFEVMFVTTKAIIRKIPGARIIGIGTSYFTLFLVACVVLRALDAHRFGKGSTGYIVFMTLAIVAALSIPAAISVYLAWSFSRTSKNLALQLVQVQTLSEQTRRQELEKQQMLENRQQELEREVDARTSEIVLQKNEIQKKHNELITEKQKSDDLLRNILPEEIAEELKNKGSSEAQYYDHVSVLFTDFVNFTTASERLSPQQLVHELHSCFKAFDEICTRYNMEKIKTIGDAYLAVCGLPVANTHHAAQVVGAALEIQQFIAERKRQFPDTSFDIRIGVHSGSVVAGIVGVKKFAYDIWGDTVNTAARMEQSSESGKINISQSTYDLVKDKFTCIFRGEIAAKNKGQLQMYFVAGAN